MRRLLGLLLAIALTALVGCGVRPEKEPTAIAIPETTERAQPAPDRGPLTVTVYFVREGRLHAAERSVADTSATTALDLLTAGPTRAEVISGVRTAIAPQRLQPHRDVTSGTADVAVTPAFTDLTGPNQLLAAAQLVWTITDLPGTDQVRLTLDRRPLEVPTDHGLSAVPVNRSDYTSVAPPDDEDPGPAPDDATTAPAVDQPKGEPEG